MTPETNSQNFPTASSPSPGAPGSNQSSNRAAGITCAMNIDGHNGLACLTPIDSLKRGTSRITPLPHMPVVKDLVPDLTGFTCRYKLIEPWLQSDQPRRTASVVSRRKNAPSSMARGSASCASAARLRARATGGTRTAISAHLSCCSPIVGSPTAAIGVPASVLIGSRTRSGSIAATRSGTAPGPVRKGSTRRARSPIPSE